MTGEENLLFVAEIVVEVALFHVERGGDFFDRGAVVTETAERLGGAFQDLYPCRGAGAGVPRAAAAALEVERFASG